MKIGFCGKGGTGKTTTTTLLATYLAKNGNILAIDSDTNENLAYALGFDKSEIESMERIRKFNDEIFAYTKTQVDWKTRQVTPVSDANYYEFIDGEMDEFLKSVSISKDNISVAHLGNVEKDNKGITGMCSAYTLMRIFLNHLKVGTYNDYLLVDLLAGDEPLARSMIINLDEMLLVVEPTEKNLSVAKDIIQSLNKLEFENFHILINKSFKIEDKEYVSEYLGIDISRIFRMEFSTEVLQLDNNCELTFDKLPKSIKVEIEGLFKSIKENSNHSEELFIKRAKKIDERLYPDSNSKQTEKHHI